MDQLDVTQKRLLFFSSARQFVFALPLSVFERLTLLTLTV